MALGALKAPKRFVAPPPEIVAPCTPGLTKFVIDPPIIFGAPLVPKGSGSSRNPRAPLTASSRAWRFVLPINWPAPTLLPPSCQKFDEAKPPTVAALTLVKPAPLPVKVLAALVKPIAPEIVPAVRFDALRLPLKAMAVTVP